MWNRHIPWPGDISWSLLTKLYWGIMFQTYSKLHIHLFINAFVHSPVHCNPLFVLYSGHWLSRVVMLSLVLLLHCMIHLDLKLWHTSLIKVYKQISVSHLISLSLTANIECIVCHSSKVSGLISQKSKCPTLKKLIIIGPGATEEEKTKANEVELELFTFHEVEVNDQWHNLLSSCYWYRNKGKHTEPNQL